MTQHGTAPHGRERRGAAELSSAGSDLRKTKEKEEKNEPEELTLKKAKKFRNAPQKKDECSSAFKS